MSKNRILQSLGNQRPQMIPRLETVRLAQGDVICRAGDPLEHLYFPESGIVSLLTASRDRRAVETGIVGREGLIGGDVVLGMAATPCDAIVQVEGEALRAPAAAVLDSLQESPALWHQINQHLNFLLLQARQNILCHALHSLGARLCRWLLQAGDRIESTTIDVTQETCAHFLGVQRSSLSMVAHALQVEGMIMTRRGKIEVLDRSRLLERSCECYGELKPHFDIVDRESTPSLGNVPASKLLSRSHERGVTVLVVDDDRAFGYAVGRYFEANGYRVTSANSSTQAIEMIKGAEFDIVITDIKLNPGEPDGLELAALIKSLRPKIPLLFVTGYPELLKGRRWFADQILLKPVEFSELARAVKERLAA